VLEKLLEFYELLFDKLFEGIGAFLVLLTILKFLSHSGEVVGS
jgi:hypothetical protein